MTIRTTVREECDDRDPALAASIAAAFNVLTALTGEQARPASYLICESGAPRSATLDEFRLALLDCKRLEVVRSENDESDVYVCQL
ncbi:MAG: hypothetical protein WCE44_01040 [Candidatus Velthaea sp.]|jgi:hypothetical protein